MRGLPFGVFFAPVWAVGGEVVLPAAAGVVLGAGVAGWVLRRVVRG